MNHKTVPFPTPQPSPSRHLLTIAPEHPAGFDGDDEITIEADNVDDMWTLVLMHAKLEGQQDRAIKFWILGPVSYDPTVPGERPVVATGRIKWGRL